MSFLRTLPAEVNLEGAFKRRPGVGVVYKPLEVVGLCFIPGVLAPTVIEISEISCLSELKVCWLMSTIELLGVMFVLV